MPRLLIFAPCQKVIYSQEDNTISIVSILQEVTVGLSGWSKKGPKGLPANLQIPMHWQALTMWLAEDGDQEKFFEQHFSFIAADGQVLIESPHTSFRLHAPPHQYRCTSQFVTFPIGAALPGTQLLKVSLREVGQTQWKEMSSFPIKVKVSIPRHPPIKMMLPENAGTQGPPSDGPPSAE